MELELPATISVPMASERIHTLTSCGDTVEARIPTLVTKVGMTTSATDWAQQKSGVRSDMMEMTS